MEKGPQRILHLENIFKQSNWSAIFSTPFFVPYFAAPLSCACARVRTYAHTNEINAIYIYFIIIYYRNKVQLYSKARKENQRKKKRKARQRESKKETTTQRKKIEIPKKAATKDDERKKENAKQETRKIKPKEREAMTKKTKNKKRSSTNEKKTRKVDKYREPPRRAQKPTFKRVFLPRLLLYHQDK